MPKVPNLNNDDNSSSPSFGSDYKFFKSDVAGLSVQIGDEPARDEQPTQVRFVPFEFFDEEKGEHYTKGYLATDEQDALEVLADDPNAIEIDESEYREATENGKRTKL